MNLKVTDHKALHGLAPCYLANDCQLVTDDGRRHLRSSEAATCVLQRTNTRFGDRAFGASGPWNSLPTELRQSDLSLGQFRRALKTFFVLTGSAAPSDCLLLGAVYKFAYLLTYLLTRTGVIRSEPTRRGCCGNRCERRPVVSHADDFRFSSVEGRDGVFNSSPVE